MSKAKKNMRAKKARDLRLEFTASQSKRLAATIIDRFLFALIVAAVFYLPAMALTLSGRDPRILAQWAHQAGQNVPGFLFLVLGWLLYCVCFEARRGATPGKRLVGCKVVDVSGKPIGWFRALRRFWVSGLNWALLGAGFLFICFRADRRGVHDLVAGTRVEDATPGNKRLPIIGWVALVAAGVFVAGFAAALFNLLA